MMKVNTEYSLGDTVWAMFENRPTEYEINEIRLSGSPDDVKEEYALTSVSSFRTQLQENFTKQSNCF